MKSEARSDSLREGERMALLGFVVTAPFIYGAFWYLGMLDDALDKIGTSSWSPPAGPSALELEALRRIEAAEATAAAASAVEPGRPAP